MTGLAPPRPAAVDGRRAHACPAALVPFADVGILTAADVHVARTLCRLFDVHDDLVLLGVAFAARAPRVGQTCLDVDRVADSVAHELPASSGAGPDDDVVAALPWPDPDAWLAAMTASPLVDATDGAAPVVVEDRLVFLARYRDHERSLAAELRARAATPAPRVDEQRLDAMLDALFPGGGPDDPQRQAARTAATHRLAVVAGGPGTGKTWTVARILAVLVDQASADGLEIALVAPTGKAAARLDEGVQDAVATMAVPDRVRGALQSLDRGATIHRLLGRRSNSRFWHDRDRPLPHDVVVVDETSMASLSLMAHLLEAVRPDARVVLVGDPDQLASVEAGSVLADVVGDGTASGRGGLADGLVVLQRPRRFGADSGIGRLARAIRDGDGDAVCEHLQDAVDLRWVPTSTPEADDLTEVHDLMVGRARGMVEHARAGRVDAALSGLATAAVLCAHRRGRDGVTGWNHRVDGWLADAVEGWRPRDPWQPGQAVLATGNDRHLQVFNGDLGVVVATDFGPRVAFHRTELGRAPVPPVRLERAEPVHAMTIHKSQGSQWDHVVVALPAAGSRILTRELLYTAATRAASLLTVIGDEAVVRHAVGRPVRRASGLRRRLTPGVTG